MHWAMPKCYSVRKLHFSLENMKTNLYKVEGHDGEQISKNWGIRKNGCQNINFYW